MTRTPSRSSARNPVRAALKGAGFRWAPSVGAWQRHASSAAWYEAKRIVGGDAGGGGMVAEASPVSALPLMHHAANDLRKHQPWPTETERLATLAENQPARPKLKGEGLDTPAIAKLIRQEIHAAVSAGDLPRAKYTVRSDSYSRGSSINVVASRLPFPVLNADAFYVEPGANFMTLDRAHYRSRFAETAQDVERKLNKIVDAYHWDRSDSLTDYYNERFARDVRIEEDAGAWKAIEAEKVRLARAAQRPGKEV